MSNPLDFNGQEIDGAENVQLDESILSGSGYASEHSDVHAWYHGTIGVNGNFPTTDDEVTIPNSWYVPPHPARNAGGFLSPESSPAVSTIAKFIPTPSEHVLVGGMFARPPTAPAAPNGPTSDSSKLLPTRTTASPKAAT